MFSEPADRFTGSVLCIVQIAVPRCGSVLGCSFTDADYETHTLIASDDRHSTFYTLNGKVSVLLQCTALYCAMYKVSVVSQCTALYCAMYKVSVVSQCTALHCAMYSMFIYCNVPCNYAPHWTLCCDSMSVTISIYLREPTVVARK